MQLVESLRALLIEQLSELYDGEKRVARAITAWADACTDPELQAALDSHALETERHVSRIEEMFEAMDTIARGRMCTGIQRMIEDSAAQLKTSFETPQQRHAAIIAGARRVEHFEVTAYGIATARARLLELGQVVFLLENTLSEEKAMEQTLTMLAARRHDERADCQEKTVCTVN